LLPCYHVTEEEDPTKENPHNIQILEVEGEREIEVPKLDSTYDAAPLKIKKVNIGTIENPKIASIQYYWDNQIVERITKLLHEYSDLFPTKFLEMKGLAGELGEIKISLNLEAKLIRQIPCRLNRVYKNKVKEKIDKMLEVGVIEPMEELEWIIPMVVQKKNQGGIRIYVDIRKLNDSCLNDHFPSPFRDEVLENVGCQDAYSFIDGFFKISSYQDSTKR